MKDNKKKKRKEYRQHTYNLNSTQTNFIKLLKSNYISLFNFVGFTSTTT